MKRRASLSRITIVVQATLFTVVLGIALLLGIYFQKHTVEEETAAKEAELTVRIRDLKSRLNGVALQVQEMLYSVIEENGLWAEDQNEKYFAKVATKNLLNDNALLYRLADF